MISRHYYEVFDISEPFSLTKISEPIDSWDEDGSHRGLTFSKTFTPDRFYFVNTHKKCLEIKMVIREKISTLHRFEKLEYFWQNTISPDGKYIVLGSGRSLSILEIDQEETKSSRWTLKLNLPEEYYIDNIVFLDSTTLLLAFKISRGDVILSRVDILSGEITGSYKIRVKSFEERIKLHVLQDFSHVIIEHESEYVIVNKHGHEVKRVVLSNIEEFGNGWVDGQSLYTHDGVTVYFYKDVFKLDV